MSKQKAEQSQADKFKQAARELGVDLDEDKLAETLRKMKSPASEKDGKPEKASKN